MCEIQNPAAQGRVLRNCLGGASTELVTLSAGGAQYLIGTVRSEGRMNLHFELDLSASFVRQAHLDKLRSLGVPMPFLAQVGCDYAPFGVANAEPSGMGLYQPGEGVPHLILPVVEDGVLVDLCAVRTADRANWMLRTGHGWALGLEHGLDKWTWHSPASISPRGELRHQVGKPTLIFPDPIALMQGSGDGICILDWSAAEVRQLDVLAEVICFDTKTALLLEQALRRPARLPQISIVEKRHAA